MEKNNNITVSKAQDESKIKDAHLAKFMRDLVSNLKEKQQEVILKRFGLSGRKKQTLDAIGQGFNVTRERVRQIEAASLTKLKKLAKLEHNRPVLEKIKTVLKENGGVIREDDLVKALILDIEESRIDELKKILKLVLLLEEEVGTIEDSEHTHSGWALVQYDKKVIEEIAQTFIEILEVKKESLLSEALLAEIKKHAISEKYKDTISPEFLKSLLSIAKKVHKSEDGKIGLVSWPWLKPRTIKDKIHYILSKKNEPMHFSEIAGAIHTASFDAKQATVQTVHNELISDTRFVLVGRGLYALNNWGYEGGTVEDVIAKVITKNTPADQNLIIEEVMKKKKVKKATILINLQNSKKFKKTSDGYILAE